MFGPGGHVYVFLIYGIYEMFNIVSGERDDPQAVLARAAEPLDGWNADLADDWTAAYELVAQVMVQAAEEAAAEPPWWDADVVEHERRTLDIAVLRLRPRSPFQDSLLRCKSWPGR